MMVIRMVAHPLKVGVRNAIGNEKSERWLGLEITTWGSGKNRKGKWKNGDK